MPNHVPSTRVALSLVTGVAALSLAACGSGAATDSGQSSAAPSSATVAPTTTTVTTTRVTPSSTAPATQTAATSSSASATATNLATEACRTWKEGDGQSSAIGSGTYDQAASTARSAAEVASDYDDLSSDMGFVSSLPLTDNTQPDVDKAQQATGRIAATCQTLGVPGIRHG